MDNGIENILEVSEKRRTLTTEASFEKYCNKIIEDLGGLQFKVTGYAGIPDRFVCPNHFIEYKICYFADERKMNLFATLTRSQRRWADQIHDHGGRAWVCVLAQHESGKSHFYLEPTVYSMWAHIRGSPALKSYYKYNVMCPGRKKDMIRDHIWQRLFAGDYYERTFDRFRDGDKETCLAADIYATKGHSPRLAP